MSRPVDLRKDYWAVRLGLTKWQMRDLSPKLIDQLERCADDDARRCLFLLAGIPHPRYDKVKAGIAMRKRAADEYAAKMARIA